MRLHFNHIELFNHAIILHDIVDRFSIFTDLRCIPNPMTIGIIDVFVDTHNIESEKEKFNKKSNKKSKYRKKKESSRIF